MYHELAVAIREGGMRDRSVGTGGNVRVDVAEEQAEGLVESFAVSAGLFDEPPGIGTHVAGVGYEEFVRFVAVTDPEFIGSLGVPADAGVLSVNFDLHPVGMAGRHMG